MIHAYNEDYLPGAMKTMASLFDVGLCSMAAIDFTDLFLRSEEAKAWEAGEPRIIAGKSGQELFLDMTGNDFILSDPGYDLSAEYWCGYVYCYVQWYLGCSFERIFSVMPAEDLLRSYPVLHEADISKVTDIIRKKLYPEAALKTWREKRALSQSQLAKISGVKLRSIKAYEQGDLDICKAQYDTLCKLAKSLCCEISDIIS